MRGPQLLRRILQSRRLLSLRVAVDPTQSARRRATMPGTVRWTRGPGSPLLARVPRYAIWLVALLAACDPGDVVLLAPGTTSEAATGSIHAVIDTPYTALTAALGWAAGVPGTQVRVHRMDEPYDSSYWHAASADSTGTASFQDLLYGLYEVEVARPLEPTETARSGQGVRVLAGGRRLYLPGAYPPEVTMAPDRHGSLVFSELELDGPYASEVGAFYPDAMYVELYNNSDTTIYLDGKYWGTGWDLVNDYRAWPCAQTEVIRNDPQGIWAAPVFRFPGTGREYPLAPGQTALIAKAAIDHRQIFPLYPHLYDLSHADFEWGGMSTADNPDVPNLQYIGLKLPFIWPRNTDMPEFLAEAVDLSSLPRYVEPIRGDVYVRIPRDAILDVWVGTSEVPEGVSVTSPPCLQATHRYFERRPGPAYVHAQFSTGISYQRRVLAVGPDGRKHLQYTNTSMFDFVKAPRTPGWIPDSLP